MSCSIKRIDAWALKAIADIEVGSFDPVGHCIFDVRNRRDCCRARGAGAITLVGHGRRHVAVASARRSSETSRRVNAMSSVLRGSA